ncbi:hypothetical protein ES702_06753 [subsurface metagenome]
MFKEEYLKAIAQTLIEITEVFHDPQRDLVSELSANKMVIDRIIIDEVARIREEERR